MLSRFGYSFHLFNEFLGVFSFLFLYIVGVGLGCPKGCVSACRGVRRVVMPPL